MLSALTGEDLVRTLLRRQLLERLNKTVTPREQSVDRACIDPVLPEVCYLLFENLGPEGEIKFLRSVTNREMLLEHPTAKDLERVVEILERYRDTPLGMVDASIMAIAERLKVETILTLDRRHFVLLPPRHCSAFSLVPDLPRRRKN